MEPNRVRVLFFASVREVVDFRELCVEVPPGGTVGDLKRQLLEEYPVLSSIIGNVAFGLNGEYVVEGALLSDGDELAVIPPVSGGNEHRWGLECLG